MDTINHARILYNILEWLGEVGGFSRAIMFLIVFIFGPASFYSAKIEMMLNFYSNKGFW